MNHVFEKDYRGDCCEGDLIGVIYRVRGTSQEATVVVHVRDDDCLHQGCLDQHRRSGLGEK